MIQRIQSLYLLINSILIAVGFNFPIAKFYESARFSSFYLYGLIASDGEIIYPISSFLILIFVLSIIIFTSIITIFRFKNRQYQIKLCNINIIISLIYFLLMLYFILRFKNALNSDLTIEFGFVTPLIGVILIYMAKRGIKKDDDLIRSADRIR